jgi:hypothetical protein
MKFLRSTANRYEFRIEAHGTRRVQSDVERASLDDDFKIHIEAKLP